ncbi:MAG: endonuclease domain-containing protein, partial [Pseudomonadota bacterium]|nr:endonuclease domain-containing protein [Pseudomonadota bacterium]
MTRFRRDPVLRDRARALRRDATPAERRLWRELRRAGLGARFRRQAPLGPYIADFLCLSARLVVELDGGQHNDLAARARDAARDRFMQERGFRVLRFWNAEVFGNLDGVLEAIRLALVEAEGEVGTDGAGPLP